MALTQASSTVSQSSSPSAPRSLIPEVLRTDPGSLASPRCALRIGKEGVCGGCFEDLAQRGPGPRRHHLRHRLRRRARPGLRRTGQFRHPMEHSTKATPLRWQSAGTAVCLSPSPVSCCASSPMARSLDDLAGRRRRRLRRRLAPGRRWHGCLPLHRQGDDVAVFDAQGNLKLYIPEAISGQPATSNCAGALPPTGWATCTRWARSTTWCLIYDAQGKYLNRFGGDGDSPVCSAPPKMWLLISKAASTSATSKASRSSTPPAVTWA